MNELVDVFVDIKTYQVTGSNRFEISAETKIKPSNKFLKISIFGIFLLVRQQTKQPPSVSIILF